MRYRLVLVGAVVLLSLALGLAISRKHNQQESNKYVTIQIGRKVYRLEIAATAEAWRQGLSNRRQLPANAGMLFRFDQPVLERFWMQGMQFPLDFIWLKDDVVVQIAENILPPCENSSKWALSLNSKPVCTKNVTILEPDQFFDKVIELNAGEIKQSGIKIGDVITIK